MNLAGGALKMACAKPLTLPNMPAAPSASHMLSTATLEAAQTRTCGGPWPSEWVRCSSFTRSTMVVVLPVPGGPCQGIMGEGRRAPSNFQPTAGGRPACNLKGCVCLSHTAALQRYKQRLYTNIIHDTLIRLSDKQMWLDSTKTSMMVLAWRSCENVLYKPDTS